MAIKIKLEQFEGPYDLLLKLIKKKELDITKVALSRVTKQYLDYVDKMEEEQAEELSDFLVVATKLLLLKSGEIIPDQQEEVEDQNLEQRLKVYRKFKQASKKIKDLWGENIAFQRQQDLSKYKQEQPPKNLDPKKLHSNMVKLIQQLEPPEPPLQTKVDETISVKEKIDHIRSMLADSDKLNFKQSIQNRENKSELIAGFLALLELVKQYELSLTQKNSFDSISINKTT
ncbi:MAG: hypothetical protein BRC22_02445 [Parcubacteria group bacterium QH_9_35_7]|nr:MAG: hypothetical protein BRC22_02445 [Parcubacteria group bacterium QH_9_35_7]